MQRAVVVVWVVALWVCAGAGARAGAAELPADYAPDLERVKEISLLFGDPSRFENQPDVVIENLKQLDAAKAEAKRIAAKYEALIKSNSFEGRNMAGVLKRFDEFVSNFEETARQYAANAPGKIDQDLQQALTMGKEAVENKRPLYFGPKGGVKQRMGWAQKKFELLAAISPDGAGTADAKKKIDDARAQVEQMTAALHDAILASNTVPEERYSGADKAQLVDRVKAKWAEAGVSGDVLKAGINSQDWKRDSRWEWDGRDTWSKTDRSRIQGFVVVKTDATHATIHFINLAKDHLSNDRITATFFEDPKAAPDISRQLLLSQVK